MKSMYYSSLLTFLLFFSGAVWTQDNYSMRFWGTSDYVHVTNCPEVQLSGDMTLMFDIRIKDSTDWDQLICLGSDTSTLVINNDLFFIQTPPGGTNLIYSHEYGNGNTEQVMFTTQLIYDAWTQVAIVRDATASMVHLYVEGVLMESLPYVNQPQGGSNTELSFGKALGSSTGYLNSLLDNISIWNFALNDVAVNVFAQCLPQGTESGIVGYWNFDEGSGIIVNDVVNGNDGILYGTTMNWRTQNRIYNCFLSIDDHELELPNKEVVKVLDLMGRETSDRPNTVLIYIYSDGSMERIYRLE